MKHRPPSAKETPPLPLAVQIGFAGTRHVVPAGTPDPEAFERALAASLLNTLRALPAELGLGPQHFIVGLSQMAIGADFAFTEGAAALGWGQRILLPQLRGDFLDAVGSAGPDFTPGQKERALTLLALPHIIDESVVSTAASRDERFDETSLQILAEADAVVCLRNSNQPGGIGGTEQLVERAVARGVTVLDLLIEVDDRGAPVLRHRWWPAQAPRFASPVLPRALRADTPVLSLQGHEWPEAQAYAACLKAQASERASRRQVDFHRAAGIIVGTHVAATLIAAAVLGHLLHGGLEIAALGAELLLLGWGFLCHRRLHAERHTEDWAMARQCAEIARSTQASLRLPGSLTYLRRLPMPAELRPLLRTLELLHLRDLRRRPATDWRQELLRYIDVRLADPSPKKGQIAYYANEQAKAHRFAVNANIIFAAASSLAFVASASKLALLAAHAPAGPGAGPVLGLLAVVLPVLAVGAMSIAAARDAEARDHTFGQMQAFLAQQAKRLRLAATLREAAALVSETEMRLLDETAAWYSRRVYTGIA